MLIPIGHEESTVRRLPWVTFGIMAACTIALLATPSGHLEELALREGPLERAAEYWREHAYLEARDEVLEYASRNVGRTDRTAYLDLLMQQSAEWQPDSAAALLKEQMALEVMTERALADAPVGIEHGGNAYLRFGLIPAQPSFLAIVTHIFMHGGWLHLIGNLLMLFIAGPALEDRWGRPLFGAFFLTSGILAGLFYMGMTPTSTAPLVGASGAIAGVLGAFLVMFAKTQIRFAYFFFLGLRWVRGTFESPAWVALPIWLGNELIQAWLMHSLDLSDGVAYWAHVGGFAAGAAIAFAIVRSGLEQKFIHSAIESKITLSAANPIVEAASVLREDGKADKAVDMLGEAYRETPTDPDLALSFWDAAVACGRADEAEVAVIGLVRTNARARNFTLAMDYWIELVDRIPTAFADPDTLLRLVRPLAETKDRARVVQALRQALDTRNPGLTPGMALRIMELASDLDPASSLRAGLMAIALSDMPPNKLERLEKRVEQLRAKGVEDPGNWEPTIDLNGQSDRSWERGEAIEIEDGDDLRKPPSGLETPSPPKARELTLHGELGDASSDGPLGEIGDSLDFDTLGLDPPDLLTSLDAEGAAMLGDEDDAYGLSGDEDAMLQESTLPPLQTSSKGESTGSSSQPSAQQPVGGLPPIDSSTPVDRSGGPGDAIELAIPLLPSDEPGFPSLKVIDARPSQLREGALYLELPDERKSRLGFAQIQAIAVAAVAGPSSKTLVVVDLLLNWNGADDGPLLSVRLRSDRFDPKPLAPECSTSGEAFQKFLVQLLAATGAVPLPDRAAASGERFAAFDDLESYEREVLRVAHV